VLTCKSLIPIHLWQRQVLVQYMLADELSLVCWNIIATI